MNLSRIKKKIKASADLFLGNSKYSYSQFGEDLIIDNFFKNILKINKPSYLNIGANKPKVGSNTYLFYLNESHGVSVEPDVHLFEIIKKVRPKEKVLNIGIGTTEANKKSIFYYFPEPYTGWNTFSEADAIHKKNTTGIHFKNDVEIELKNINTIICENFYENSPPDFISLDVEGLEIDILNSLNFVKYSPKLLCVETMQFSDNKLGKKNEAITNILKNNGYSIYADTFVNSIFVQSKYINS